MGWFKKDKSDSDVGITGHPLHVNPHPLSQQHVYRTVERIKRIRYTLDKIQDKKSERFQEFSDELARLEIAFLVYKNKIERKNK